MTHLKPQQGALVLYKSSPARILAYSDKIEIQLINGKNKRVREKDITLLHPGPVSSLAGFDQTLQGEIEEAWELLGEDTIPLMDLSELIYGETSPHAVWSSWQIISDDLLFHGSVGAVSGYPAERVEAVQQTRNTKAREQQEKAEFLERLNSAKHSATLSSEDLAQLSDVEMLALGRSEVSRILRDLGRDQRPENGHHLLLECSYWEQRFNPYPIRMGLEIESAEGEIPTLDDAPRVDLTHLTSWAIDDTGNRDPDDAISLDGERIWVHVADVSALITPDSPLDLQARARGANLYIPEGTRTMLPFGVTEQLGLGLADRSPALSFSFTLSSAGEVENIEVVTSWVKVIRTTYDAVEQEIEGETFAPLYRKALQFQEKRSRQGAIRLNLPEVKIQLKEDDITITPLPRLRSRDLVTDFMLMAGEAAARFAQQHEIPFPFSTQPPPEGDEQGNPYPHPQTPAEMYSFRRRFQRSQLKSQPEPHSGLGMKLYSQVTSPLRRYLDLVAHQQLRAWIHHQPLLDSEAVTERVGAAEAVIGNVRRAERFSNQHWTLLWLKEQSHWSGEAVLVNTMKQRGTFLIPELGLECKARLQKPTELNQTVTLKLAEIDLPELTPYFQVVSN